MANEIQLKRSSVSGRIPDTANVLVGEPVVNLADQILYTKNGSGNVIIIGAGTTSNISEGTNLYFTDARVSTALSNQTLSNASFSGNVTASYFIGDGSLLTNLATAPGGFENSTLTAFPSGDFGNLSYSLDAFGVSLVPVYDCMEPEGSLLTVDLETLT